MAGSMCVVRLLLLLVLLVGLRSCHSARILMAIFHDKSHVHLFGQLGRALVEDGHQVSLLASDEYKELIEGHKIKPLTFNVPKDADIGERLAIEMEKTPSGSGIYEQNYVQDVWPEPGRYCDLVLGNETLMGEVEEEGFDLAVMDGSVPVVCMYTIPYKYNIPYITLQTFQVAGWGAGLTGLPSIEPDIMLPLTNKMSFWQRLQNLQAWLSALDDPFLASFDKHFLQTYAPEKPLKKFSDIIKDSEMFLANYDVTCLDFPRVSAPHYQYLGPSSVSEVKPLPPDVEAFVQGAEHGLVVLSLGSFSAWQSTWRLIRDKMFTALGRLQERAVVQYALKDARGEVPENILLMDYIPQNDLLANPRTRLFITHGGNNGQNEAVYHGVPMVVVPVMVDQPYAGTRAEAKGYGRYVRDKAAITADQLYHMMREVMDNPAYSANVKKCSCILHSLPSAKERVVLWVNHLLQFGGAHLRPPSVDMPLYQVLMLDIVGLYVGLGVGAGLGVLTVGGGVGCVLYRCLRHAGKDKED